MGEWGATPPLNAATVQPRRLDEGGSPMPRTAYSADAFFSMDSFSFRSLEPSLRSSAQSVQTRLTVHTPSPALPSPRTVERVDGVRP